MLVARVLRCLTGLGTANAAHCGRAEMLVQCLRCCVLHADCIAVVLSILLHATRHANLHNMLCRLQAAATGETLLDEELSSLARKNVGRFHSLNQRLQAQGAAGPSRCVEVGTGS